MPHISGRMPIDPSSREMRDIPGNQRVNIRLALEPGNRYHRDCEVKVSSRQFSALQVANQAIQDTHRILYMGSGDQLFHSARTDAETFKRLLVMKNRVRNQNMTPIENMWEAKRFRTGNCGEMAMVCAQLIASSGLNQPVSVVETRGDTDHTYVVIGGPGEEKVVADPWALFSRAMLKDTFHFSEVPSRTVHRFEPEYDPNMRAALLGGGIVSRNDVEDEFAQLNSQMGNLSDRELLEMGIENKWIYNQFHASDNLGETYSNGSGSNKRVIDQNMSKAEYQDIYNGPRPTPLEPRVSRSNSRRYPPPAGASSSTPQRSQSFRSRRASTYQPEADISDRMRRMSMSESARPRRESFAAEAAPPRPQRYSMSGGRPVMVEVRQPTAESSRRERRRRDRDNSDRLQERRSGFSSFFFRR